MPRNDIVCDIGNFIFVEHKPEKADIIIIVGGSYPQLAEKAAELFHNGYAPLILAGGGYSIKHGHFKGVSDKADIYDGSYNTECDFFTEVLKRNNIPLSAIIREDKSSYTRENAEFAKKAIDDNKIKSKKIIIICKRFHARRCEMFFKSYFPKSEILVVPPDIGKKDMGLTKDNWFTTEYGIKRVLGELSRCGEQFSAADISNYLSGKEEKQC